MAKHYWLVKQEPEDFSWSTFLEEKKVAWTGVRNFAARNHLRSMARGDLVLFYHSGKEKQVVGLARVSRSAYPDPTAKEGDWAAVDLVPVETLPRRVPLSRLKTDPLLKGMALVRQGRLSVSPVEPAQFQAILTLGR